MVDRKETSKRISRSFPTKVHRGTWNVGGKKVKIGKTRTISGGGSGGGDVEVTTKDGEVEVQTQEKRSPIDKSIQEARSQAVAEAEMRRTTPEMTAGEVVRAARTGGKDAPYAMLLVPTSTSEQAHKTEKQLRADRGVTMTSKPAGKPAGYGLFEAFAEKRGETVRQVGKDVEIAGKGKVTRVSPTFQTVGWQEGTQARAPTGWSRRAYNLQRERKEYQETSVPSHIIKGEFKPAYKKTKKQVQTLYPRFQEKIKEGGGYVETGKELTKEGGVYLWGYGKRVLRGAFKSTMGVTAYRFTKSMAEGKGYRASVETAWDKDVRTYYTTAGIVSLGFTSPVAAKAMTYARRGVGAYTTYKFVETAEPKYAATTLLLFSPEIYKASPVKPKVEWGKFDVKTSAGTIGKQRFITAGLKVGYKEGAGGVPLVTYSGGKVSAGYGFNLKGIPIGRGGEPYLPRGELETKLYVKNVGKFVTQKGKMLVEGKSISPELQRRYVVESVRAQQRVGYVKTKLDKKILIEGTERLKGKTVKNVFYLSESKGGLPYGSKPAMAQVYSGVRRSAHDIDLHFQTSSETKLGDITKSFLEVVKKTEQARIPKSAPFSIETKTASGWQKAIEFKGIGIGDSEAAVAPAKAYGYLLDVEKHTRSAGEYGRIASIVGESKRKLAASSGLREGSIGVAHTGRFKDVPDYARIIFSQARESGKLSDVKGFFDVVGELGVDFKSGQVVTFSGVPSSVVSGSVSPASVLSVSAIPSFKIGGRRSPKDVSPSVRSSSLSSASLSSISPYTSGSPSPSPSPSPSVSPSPSLSLSPSPYPSPSPSMSPSPSPSPSVSPSPSLSLSPSPSMSPSPSPSPSPIPPSPSPSPSPSPFLISSRRTFGKMKSPKISPAQPKRYTPTGYSATFQVKGSPLKSGEATGLGLRPIKAKKKKKKRGKKWKLKATTTL